MGCRHFYESSFRFFFGLWYPTNSQRSNRIRNITLVGNGIDEESLKRAGIEEADAFVAVTQGDNRNVMAAQIAKHIFNVPLVICRIYDPIRRELYNTLGIETFSPTTIFSQMLKERLEI